MSGDLLDEPPDDLREAAWGELERAPLGRRRVELGGPAGAGARPAAPPSERGLEQTRPEQPFQPAAGDAAMDAERRSGIVCGDRRRAAAHEEQGIPEARVADCVELLHRDDGTCDGEICIDSQCVFRSTRYASSAFRGRDVMLGRLLHGVPGHPLHPPLTDATIGMFVLASGLCVIGALGWLGDAAGKGAWLALIGGLLAAAPTATTGFADWLTLEWGSPVWRTATLHLTAMVTAVCLFGVAAWLQWDGYEDGSVTTGGLVFALVGFGALTAGGWLGGAIVFVHGMRVEAARASQEVPRHDRDAA